MKKNKFKQMSLFEGDTIGRFSPDDTLKNSLEGVPPSLAGNEALNTSIKINEPQALNVPYRLVWNDWKEFKKH